MKVAFVTIDYDPDPDFSWLEQDCFADMPAAARDPANHVMLEMVAYNEKGEVYDSLGGIDFLTFSDDWTIGTFYSLNAMPKHCEYLRELAGNMGLAC